MPRTSVAVCLAAAVLGCEARPVGEEVGASTRYLTAAVEAAEWLRGAAGSGGAGPIPDEWPGGEAGASLGTGAAGRALFFAELSAATADPAYCAWSIDEARHAAETDVESFGLYNGKAGVAFALEAVGRLCGEPSLVSEARRQLDAIVAAEAPGAPEDGGWGGTHDVITGRAGIGLALLAAFEAFEEPGFLDAAVRAGDDLLQAAERLPDGHRRWLRSEDIPLDLPNFSHGTAGVGFFLARLGAASGEPRFLDGARDAAAYLDAVADRGGGLYLVPYAIPNEGYETVYDIGWAHGPAGTARLHEALRAASEAPDLADRIDASARTILASGAPGESLDPERWSVTSRIDRRFGTSGAAIFLLDWGRLRESERFVEAGTRMVDDVLQRASRTEDGLRWSLPRYGFQGGEGDAVFTGYLYGSAGLGLTLLHAHFAETGAWPRIRLPDDPFPRAGEE